MTRWRTRCLGWTVLVVLTLVILFFPVHLVSQYRPIQAPYIFGNLSVFSLVFCLWAVVLVLLAFLRRDDKTNWEHFILAGISGIVFIGFWSVIAAPYGSYADDIYNSGHVRYIVEERHILIGHPVLAYFDYPGMHIFVAALSEISGLGVFEARTLFLVLNAGLFCSLMYLVFAGWVKRSRLAFLSVMLMMMTGSAIITRMHIFMASAFAYTLLSVFLLALQGQLEGSWENRPRQAIVIQFTAFSAMVISYFATTLLVPLALAGTYLVQRLAGERRLLVPAGIVLVFSAMFLGWLVFATRYTSHELAGYLERLVEDLSSGAFLGSMKTLAQANLGTQLPLWANCIRLLSWSFLAAATVVALSCLLALKKRSSAERLEIGGLLGVLAMTVAGLAGTMAGIQFARYLLYAPLFAMPLLAGSLTRWRDWGQRALVVLVVCVAVVSLPVFLCSVNTVATDVIYAYDASSGMFLGAHSLNRGENMVICRASTNTASSAYYYLPNVSFRTMPESAYYLRDKNAFWDEVEKLTADYIDPDTDAERQKLFMVDEKTFAPAEHLLAISPDDEGWQELDLSVSAGNHVYDNGHVQMYTP